MNLTPWSKSLSRLSNLQQRLLIGLPGSALFIFLLAWSSISYALLMALLLVLSMLEFYRLVRADDNIPLLSYGTFCGLAVFVATYCYASGLSDERILIALFPLCALIFHIKLYKKDERKPFTNIAYTFLGILYVAVPLSLLNLAVFHFEQSYRPQLIIGYFLLLWASDTGAYFAGTRFGRTKLFERISPKKSWEGLIGGMALALAIAACLEAGFDCLPPFTWYGMAVLIVIAATYGDLVESLFKRSLSIKDSGASLPGHGGFLDRFDGLFLSSPFVVTFILLM